MAACQDYLGNFFRSTKYWAEILGRVSIIFFSRHQVFLSCGGQNLVKRVEESSYLKDRKKYIHITLYFCKENVQSIVMGGKHTHPSV